MNDLDELLRYGLNEIGDHARPLDLREGVNRTANSIHRRRIAVRMTAGLIGLGLALSAAVALRDISEDTSRIPPVHPTPTPIAPSGSTPWISSKDLADLTLFAPWDSSPFSGWVYSPHPKPETTVCGTPAGPATGGTPADSSAYLANLGGTESVVPEMIAYTVVRYDASSDALAAYQALDGRMQACGSLSGSTAAFQVLDGWTLPGWELAGLRQREQLVQHNCSDCIDRYSSTMILLWDRYLAVVTWVTPKASGTWNLDDPHRAAKLAPSLLTSIIRLEHRSLPPSGSDRSSSLGPAGFGRVELGMTAAEALATGQLDPLTILGPNGTSSCTTAELRADSIVGVRISARFGVVVIDAGPNVFTPEGLGRGTTLAEFKRMYPNFRKERSYSFSAPVPGNPDARYFVDVARLEDEPLRVIDLMLVSSVQDDCINQRLGLD